MLEKPKIGMPCNGCGICCKAQVCLNGAFAMGLVDKLGDTIKGECPALTSNSDGSFACGVVLYPKKYLKKSYSTSSVLSKNFAHLIGAGTGCDELLEDDSKEEEEKLNTILANMQQDNNWLQQTKIALKIIHNINI